MQPAVIRNGLLESLFEPIELRARQAR